MASRKEPRKPPGLKASCDLCHQAKVKCIFDNADQCTRCARHNYTCKRSPSLPMGRIPGSTNRRQNPDTACCRRYRARCECSSMPSASPEAAHGVSEPPASAPTTPTSTLVAEMPPICQAGSVEFDMMPLVTMGWMGTESLLTPTSTALNDVLDANVQISGGGGTAACTCFHAITETMEQMQQASPETKPLDALLRRNRVGLSTVSQFLHCGASHEATLVLLVYMLFYNILAGYAAAGLQSLDGASTEDLRIWLGEFEIDRHETHALKHHFILLDLGKTPGLLEELAERVAARDSASYDRTYLFVQSLLRREAERLIQAMNM